MSFFMDHDNQLELYDLLQKFFDVFLLDLQKMYVLYDDDDDYTEVRDSLKVLKTMKDLQCGNRDIITENNQLFMKWYWTTKKPSWNTLLEFEKRFEFIRQKFDIYFGRLPKDSLWLQYWTKYDIEELNHLGSLLSLYIKEVVQEPVVAASVPTQNEMDMLKEELERTKLELAETKGELQKTKEELEKMRNAYLSSIEWMDESRRRSRMEFDVIQVGHVRQWLENLKVYM
jgi:hypothetical protein